MTIAAPTIIAAEGVQQRQLFFEEEALAHKRAINREGIFLLGPRVQSLEGVLQARYQVAQALGTNAGTAALELACEGLKERLVRDRLAYGQRANYWQIMLPGKNGKRASSILSIGEGLMTVDKAPIFIGVALAWFLVTVMVANAARITEQLFTLRASAGSISVERAV